MKIRCLLVSILMVLSMISVGLFFDTGISASGKIKLSKSKLTLTVGKTKTIKLKKAKKLKVKWSSSNKKVATVTKNGKIKAKKKGTAKIIAKYKGKKYICKVTVKKKKVSTPTTEEKTTEATTETTTETKEDDQKPSEDTKKYDAGEYSLDSIHSGEATYYDRENQGCADLDYMEEKYYTAALNKEDYLNNMAGAYLEVTDKDGDKINVVITDMLPEGKKGDIDLTRKTFAAIEPLATGRMKVTWRILPLPTTENISYKFKDGSTKWWAQVQVRDHRYPIAKFEFLDEKTGEFVELNRTSYNYYTASGGKMGAGPYTFRVTDIYGHVIVDKDIPLKSDGSSVKGSSNFPY